jgi:hypothetical protein
MILCDLIGDYNYLEFISNSKSGQFFFYSHDGKYMLKTQTKEENKFMRRVLPSYYKYMMDNPHSLLVRILDMYRIEMYHLRRKVHFVVMTSVFDSPAKIHSIYDLKGSLIGRSATEKERETGGVLKDMDLIKDQRKLHLGVKKSAFMKQLHHDAAFLASLHIMDYSLLVGIHDRHTREVMPSQPAMEAIQPTSATAATASRTHSNTPFRRSLHADAPSAQVMTNTLELNVVSSAESRRSSKRLSITISAENTPTKITAMEQKEAHASPAQLLDELAMKDLHVHQANNDHHHHRQPQQQHPALPQQQLALSDNGEEDDGIEEEEDDDDEEEDIDEGDSDDGHGQTMATKLLRASADDQHLVAKFSTVSDSEGHAYGNGITLNKPWTSRMDSGINSRIGKYDRGEEIYFVGIIDILQEYNTSKRAETMIKVC